MATQKRFIAKNGIDNNSNSIINVANPTNAQDAATKSYVDSLSGSSGTQRTTTTVIPTVGQTVFTIAYTVGFIDVFYNGIKLVLADDFVATNGTSVTLTDATISGDVVEFVTYLNVALANTYTQTQTNALFAPIASPTLTGTTTVTNLAYTGTLTGSTGILNIGSGQVYKDASGNVGIGTTAPTNKLTVNGGIDFSGSAFSGSGTGIWQQAINKLGFVTAGSTRFIIDATGNVGIGTTTPAQKLSVVGVIESTTGGVKFPDNTVQTSAATAVTYATMLKFQ
jgi:hypothetical protein